MIAELFWLLSIFAVGFLPPASARPDPNSPKFGLMVDDYFVDSLYWDPIYRKKKFYLTTIPYPKLNGTLVLPAQKDTSPLEQLVVRIDTDDKVMADFNFYKRDGDDRSWGRKHMETGKELILMTGNTTDLNVPWGFREPSFLPYFAWKDIRPPDYISPKKEWTWWTEDEMDSVNGYIRPRTFRRPKVRWVCCANPAYNAPSWDGKMITVAEVYLNFNDNALPGGCQEFNMKLIPS